MPRSSPLPPKRGPRPLPRLTKPSQAPASVGRQTRVPLHETHAHTATHTQKRQAQTLGRRSLGYLEAFIIAYVIVTFIFTTVGVVGSSMQPTLNGGNGTLPQSLWQGDRVFIPKYDTWLRRLGVLSHYKRGEIVVVREPKNSPTVESRRGIPPLKRVPLIGEIPFVQGRPFFIKRLIGVPGDRIRIEKGQVFVNGYEVDQSFITSKSGSNPAPVDFPVIMVNQGEVVSFEGLAKGTKRITFNGSLPVPVTNPQVQRFYGTTLEALAPLPENAPEGEPFVHELIVPVGHYFVLGDNRGVYGSEDSRYFGPVKALTVAGRVTHVIWPPLRHGKLNWRPLRPPETFNDIPSSSVP